MAGDVHIEVAASELNGANHRLLANQQRKVAQRAERQGVARSNQEAADREYLLARHAVSAGNQDTGPACTRAAGSMHGTRRIDVRAERLVYEALGG